MKSVDDYIQTTGGYLDPANSAAVAAADRFVTLADFSADDFAMLLSQPNTVDAAERRRTEKRLQDAVFAGRVGQTFRAVGTPYAQCFPQARMNQRADLKTYLALANNISDAMRDGLVQEALAWANKLIDSAPERAGALAASKAGSRYIARASSLLLKIDAKGAKRAIREDFKFVDRMVRKLHEAEEVIAAKGCAADQQCCLAVVCQHLYGHIRPQIAFALASLYCYYMYFAFLVRFGYFGANPSGEKILEFIDAEDGWFKASIQEHSTLLGLLAPFDRVLVGCSVDDARRISGVIRSEREVSISLSDEWQKDFNELDALKKSRHKEAQDLREKVAEQTKTIERLNGRQDKGLITENLALMARVAELTEAVAHRDELLSKRNGVSLPKPKPSPAPPPKPASLPAAAGSLGPAMSREAATNTLNSLKGVVVGGHRNFHNKVSPLLPGWQFFDADEYSIDETILRNADLVVFHTDYCSHKLTEGALRKCRLFKTPVVYAYKINPPAFVVEVAEARQKLVG